MFTKQIKKEFEGQDVISTTLYLPKKYNAILKYLAKERKQTIQEVAIEIMITTLKYDH